jgi:proline iminopeptidase
MQPNLKLVFALLLASSTFMASACKKNDDNKEAPAAEAAPEVSSAEQLKKAEFKSEEIRKLYSKYTTGKEFCKKFESVTANEKSVRIAVPVDYKDPKKGTTEIYAYFAGSQFDPKLPTLIYFDGGSGGNSHGLPKLTRQYNQLQFDQRGIGCSRPAKLELYRDPSFYSSENNARDANEIRKHFNISKLSVYGVSYGSVPATIFGNLFPEATTSVVLEGVMFSGLTTGNSNIIQHELKKMYASFPAATKEAMLSYFTKEKAAAIYTLARMAMYGNNGFEKVRSFLLSAFPSKDKIDKETADKYFSPKFVDETFFETDSIDTVDYVNNRMLDCKESSENEQTISLFFSDKIEGKQVQYEFVPYKTKDTQGSGCESMAIPKDAVGYSADRYPLTVPVTYFQGTWDGATMAKGAIQHWKKVPRNQRQMFLAVQGGHTPNFKSLLDLKNLENQKAQLQVFEKALAGQLSSEEEAQKLNANQTEVKWAYTQKEVTQTPPPENTETQTAAAPAKSTATPNIMSRPVSPGLSGYQ